MNQRNPAKDRRGSARLSVRPALTAPGLKPDFEDPVIFFDVKEFVSSDIAKGPEVGRGRRIIGQNHCHAAQIHRTQGFSGADHRKGAAETPVIKLDRIYAAHDEVCDAISSSRTRRAMRNAATPAGIPL